MVPCPGSSRGADRGAQPRSGDYAARLLADLGAGASARGPRGPDSAGPDAELAAAEAGAALPHPDLEWARSGAMLLTGYPDRAPLLAPAPLALCAARAVEAFRASAGQEPSTRSGDRMLAGAERPNGFADRAALAGLDRLDGAALLGEHAAAFGHERRGDISAGGSCRLLRASDGHIALNLARPEDVELLPAWLGAGDVGDPWSCAIERVAQGRVEALVERGRLMGLPVAPVVPPPEEAPPWFRLAALGEARAPEPRRAPLVVDLTSLWAGPLCAHLLGLAGARVIKVESVRRPDGTRRGAPAFFDLLNAGKESVALDFNSDGGRRRLGALVVAADIVIEAARPRAMLQLGIDAEALVAARPGLTWVSITGYGRREPEAGWVAFGDDAAVAAGLAVATGRAALATGAGGGDPLFCGDAIADPLTGIHAAVAALASWRAGGGRLLDLSLRDVVGHVMAYAGEGEARCGEGCVAETGDGSWEVEVEGVRQPVLPPRMREARGCAPELGADTAAILLELGIA